VSTHPDIACVDVAAFPLQLLLRQHPTWRDLPVAVVAEDKPLAPILWVNEPARRNRILPGMRYASGLSLAPNLCADVIDDAAIVEGIDQIRDALLKHTDQVEPATDEPGVLWLNVRGLDQLHPDQLRWATSVRESIGELGFISTAAVGFTRFGTYALAKNRWAIADRAPLVLDDPNEEKQLAGDVPLDRLGIDPKLRDDLEKLGVRTVARFLRLPAEGLLERFGPDAHRLHRLAGDRLWSPLQPSLPEAPVTARVDFDEEVDDASQILFIVKRMLHPLLAQLAEVKKALLRLDLHLALDRAADRDESIQVAAPTLDEAQILDLVRLRVESLQLAGGAKSIALSVTATDASTDQLMLFAQRPRRDLDAAARAFARLVAELGEGSVVKACLTEGHLPEATYRWAPLRSMDRPRPSEPDAHPMIRRLAGRPVPLPPRPRHLRDDGWLVTGVEQGAVVNLEGPYVVSGGWWATPIHRDYYFAETRRGDILWVYYDRRRRRWFLHAQVQ